MAYTITEAQAVELLKIADALVGKRVKSGYIADSDRDDYIQDLMLIMVRHQSDWDIPEGVKFEAFADTVMKKRLISVWRERHGKRDLFRDMESLNAEFCNDCGETEEFINLVTDAGAIFSESEFYAAENREHMRQKIRLFVETLPEKQRNLCHLIMRHDLSEISDILDRNRSTIWRLMGSIRKKMLRAGIAPAKNFSKKSGDICNVLGGYLR